MRASESQVGSSGRGQEQRSWERPIGRGQEKSQVGSSGRGQERAKCGPVVGVKNRGSQVGSSGRGQDKRIVNWLLTSSQLPRTYQGDSNVIKKIKIKIKVTIRTHYRRFKRH